MHLVITDSGLGGLSVCAKLMFLLKERASKEKNTGINLRITYINASPSNDRGYNDMSDIVEQNSAFKKILKNVEKIFSPDLIFIACGTLSGLLKGIIPSKHITNNIKDILPIGTKLLLDNIKKDRRSKIIIFGTPTTIHTKIFEERLLKKGISKNRIFSQACPNLASMISNDFDGYKVSKLINEFVKKSLNNIRSNPIEKLIVFLGCTHYAYRQNFFLNSFRLEGYNNLNILSPNLASAIYLNNFILKNKSEFKTNKISLEFVSPYSIPIKEKYNLSKLLYLESIDTALALKNEIIYPELLQD